MTEDGLPSLGSSVVTPSHHQTGFTEEALRTVKNQEYPRDFYYLKAPRSSHVSRYAAHMLENALEIMGFVPLRTARLGVPFQLASVAPRLLYRTGLIRNLWSRLSKVSAVLMGPEGYRLIPVGIFNKCVLYCYDCWPENFTKWELLRRFRIDMAFFSARASAEEFEARIPMLKAYWVPEGTNPSEYIADKALEQRSIDVLELGRRFQAFHDAITPTLIATRHRHLYESVPGRIIFSTRQELVDGLADSKLLICYPASITHPGRARNLETVTHRYFEGVASRCLLVGHAPQELVELFGYNPVIEVLPANAAERITDILSNISVFQPLVDRNYESVVQRGTWLSRVRQIIDLMSSGGSGIKGINQ